MTSNQNATDAASTAPRASTDAASASELVVRPGGIIQGARVFTLTVADNMTAAEIDQQLENIADALDVLSTRAGGYYSEQGIAQSAADVWDVLSYRRRNRMRKGIAGE